MDWRWTGAFLILNISEQLLMSDNIIGALCSLVTASTQLELACITVDASTV